MEIVLVIFGILNCALIVVLLLKKNSTGLDTAMRDEFMRNRKEFHDANKELRQELTVGLTQTKESLDKRLEPSSSIL